MPKRIETVAQLVTALGGTTALANWLDVVPSTVSNWKEHDRIPPGWHLQLYLECRTRELSVAPGLFGIKENSVTDAPPARPSRRAEARSAV
ncbi:protein of unknown function [Hyphomicrobium sp. 1Nfss2.1]|uniref:carph-isopro domain-containing protein n=1 Tax=Hyphomicrobium sp. 1Nfss2.1 TaxID=3413936 RepID=UPI003C7DF2EA